MASSSRYIQSQANVGVLVGLLVEKMLGESNRNSFNYNSAYEYLRSNLDDHYFSDAVSPHDVLQMYQGLGEKMLVRSDEKSASNLRRLVALYLERKPNHRPKAYRGGEGKEERENDDEEDPDLRCKILLFLHRMGSVKNHDSLADEIEQKLSSYYAGIDASPRKDNVDPVDEAEFGARFGVNDDDVSDDDDDDDELSDWSEGNDDNGNPNRDRRSDNNNDDDPSAARKPQISDVPWDSRYFKTNVMQSAGKRKDAAVAAGELLSPLIDGDDSYLQRHPFFALPNL